MLRTSVSRICVSLLLWGALGGALPTSQVPLVDRKTNFFNRTVSTELFYELEELARIVDISYCVGTTGIQKPFICASRCQDFDGFELVTTWNTGPLLSDSCGYIAVSHLRSRPRIIVAFRGTYSVANTIVDLSTIPQEYIPYPEDGDQEPSKRSVLDSIRWPIRYPRTASEPKGEKCDNCTVHAGFMRAWRHTRAEIMPYLESSVAGNPGYQLTLVGHSLGGAVAALGSLDFKARGWNPRITTFGEPRLGNEALMKYIDRAFASENNSESGLMFRRVTHVDDPVPLLPLKEWGFKMHAGEIYISKTDLSPTVADLTHCIGDQDPDCIASADPPICPQPEEESENWPSNSNLFNKWSDINLGLGIPSRLKIWQLFFAHRDYFWRLGLCVPGGDPFDWYRKYPRGDSDEL